MRFLFFVQAAFFRSIKSLGEHYFIFGVLLHLIYCTTLLYTDTIISLIWARAKLTLDSSFSSVSIFTISGLFYDLFMAFLWLVDDERAVVAVVGEEGGVLKQPGRALAHLDLLGRQAVLGRRLRPR